MTALFLDVDGTLLDIAPTPEAVIVPPKLPELLVQLGDFLGGALALVSGRSLAQLDELFAPYRFAAAGQHGAEIRRSGETCGAVLPNPHLDKIRQHAQELVSRFPGVRVEDKGCSLAVHFRQAPNAREDIARELSLQLRNLPELEMIPAKMAFDIKPKGQNKGIAVAALLSSAPFAGRVPLFFGDDVTDRFGMAASKQAGGFAVQVGPVPPGTWDVKEDFFLPTPAAVVSWLRTYARVLEAGAADDGGRSPQRSTAR